jgi:hypothetical protein
MQPKQFRNLIESARSIVNPMVENGDHDCKGKHDHENEDSVHHEIKHKGKTCKQAHPGMEHEEWEMSQNEGHDDVEGVELDEYSSTSDAGQKQAKWAMQVKPSTIKKHTPKTNKQAKLLRKVSRNLERQDKLYASTEYELQDSTKESLARFIGEKIERGEDGIKRLKGAFPSQGSFHGMSQKGQDAVKARREKEAKSKPKQQNNSVEYDGDGIQEVSSSSRRDVGKLVSRSMPTLLKGLGGPKVKPIAPSIGSKLRKAKPINKPIPKL